MQMQLRMHAFPVSLEWHSLPLVVYLEAGGVHAYPLSYLFPATARLGNTIPITSSSSQAFAASKRHSLFRFKFRLAPSSSKVDSSSLLNDDDHDSSGSLFSDTASPSINGDDDGIEIEIEKTGKNCRSIRSKIAVEASLETVWAILTDYERLADFIPGLAVSQLLEKRGNIVRLFQIGQQNLAFGLKFNAKGIVECYEKDLESHAFGQIRDIEFKMIEGDFQLFEGKWSIEQCNSLRRESSDPLVGQEFHTTLSYIVNVKPKLWLPVRFVESRLCREIKMNLSCIRGEAEKAFQDTLPSH